MAEVLRHLRSLDADQLAAWVCLHPNPTAPERAALARLVKDLPHGGKALPVGVFA